MVHIKQDWFLSRNILLLHPIVMIIMVLPILDCSTMAFNGELMNIFYSYGQIG